MFVLVSPIFPAVRVETQFSDFLDGLGPAQLVGRQTLATPAIGKFCLFVKFFIYFVSFSLVAYYPYPTLFTIFIHLYTLLYM